MKKILLMIAVLGLMTACSQKKEMTEARGEAIELLREVCATKQVDHTLQVIDSLEQAGEMRPPVSDYWRGLVYDMGWRYRLAGYYYQRAFDAYKEPVKDWKGYAQTGYRLACMKNNMQDHDECLRIATRLVAQADSLQQAGSQAFPRSIHAFLISLIASYQQPDEANSNCLRAYEVLTGGHESDAVDRIVMCSENVERFTDAGDLDAAEEWLERAEEELSILRQQMAAGREVRACVVEYRKRLALLQAIILQARGNEAEAAKVYNAMANDSQMLLEPANLEVSVRYLMAAGRHEEALTFMNRIDTLSPPSERPHITFDIISSRMVPRYEALLKGGHNAEALATATDICKAIDSALTAQKQNDAAELAVIYESNLKDRALEQKETTEYIHLIIILGLVLLLGISGVALWHILMVQRRLNEKNRQLFASVQQMIDKEQQAEQQLQALPQEELTAVQKLYLRICQLMDDERPYTNAELSREDLAQCLGTNYKYVADAIRECSDGMTITDFLNHHRLGYAAQLLATTNEPVTLISDIVGFNNRSYFYRLFREHYKLTPTEYRKVAKEA